MMDAASLFDSFGCNIVAVQDLTESPNTSSNRNDLGTCTKKFRLEGIMPMHPLRCNGKVNQKQGCNARNDGEDGRQVMVTCDVLLS